MTNQNKKEPFIKSHKTSVLLIAVVIIVAFAVFLSPTSAESTNPCASCHGPKGYFQYLDLLEGNPTNTIPSSLNVGESTSITVAVENIVNTSLFNTLTDVSLTLKSENGFISIHSPTVNIKTLQKGKTTATWQITGTSAGSDILTITAKGTNIHMGLQFSDTYSPAPTITVLAPTPIPMPTSTPTSVPTQEPTSEPIDNPTPIPTSTPFLSSMPTQIPVTPNIPIQQATPSPKDSTPEPSNLQTQQSNSSAVYSVSYETKENATIPTLKIWFKDLREGETWTAGTQKEIKWVTSGDIKNITVKLEISKIGSNGPWTTIAENFTDSNSFIWKVADQDRHSSIIRATAIDIGNPTQIASVTIAVKILPAIRLDNATLMLSIPILLPLAVIIAIMFRRRSVQAELRKNKILPAENHEKLNPTTLFYSN